MKATILTLGMTLAAALGNSALAQSRGEADPDQARAAATKPATKAEKAAARKDRITEGNEVSKTATSADDMPNNLGRAKASTKSERAAAAAQRKAETRAAVKRGEISYGEK